MSTTTIMSCIYCQKECKGSDSRPYPNSKAKERIHNKCQVKKTLADKKQLTSGKLPDTLDEQPPPKSIHEPSMSIMERVAKEESDIKKEASERKMIKLVEEQSRFAEKSRDTSGQFFFDLKAGIAKPHEKKRYLHHRNLCEIATRYDDNGFHDEAAGRAYDHAGKDLNTLGDDSDGNNVSDNEAESRQDGEDQLNFGCNTGKRRLNTKDDKICRDRKQSRLKLDEENPCWFCLSSPKVEKHLIVAIGDFCYLTLAKGGLVDEHFLLIPINHVQSLNDSKANSQELLEELERFKKSLVDYFGARAKGVVFFERNFKSVHWQLQAVPIPLDVIDTIEDSIKSISKEHFANSSYLDIPAKCMLTDIIPPGVPYFYWQLEPIGTRFVTQIQVKGSFFPIQLGRLVLADHTILDCNDKIDWKICVKTKEEYVDLVRQTKDRYREFDIT